MDVMTLVSPSFVLNRVEENGREQTSSPSVREEEEEEEEEEVHDGASSQPPAERGCVQPAG